MCVDGSYTFQPSRNLKMTLCQEKIDAFFGRYTKIKENQNDAFENCCLQYLINYFEKNSNSQSILASINHGKIFIKYKQLTIIYNICPKKKNYNL